MPESAKKRGVGSETIEKLMDVNVSVAPVLMNVPFDGGDVTDFVVPVAAEMVSVPDEKVVDSVSVVCEPERRVIDWMDPMWSYAAWMVLHGTSLHPHVA